VFAAWLWVITLVVSKKFLENPKQCIFLKQCLRDTKSTVFQMVIFTIKWNLIRNQISDIKDISKYYCLKSMILSLQTYNKAADITLPHF